MNEVNMDATGGSIRCVSRHNLEGEMNLMRGIAKLLDRYGLPVEELFFDSKHGVLSAQIKVQDIELANKAASYIEGWLLQFYGGHNGVLVRFCDVNLALANPLFVPKETDVEGV
jgi:hypothetical protein